ncbi:arylsulfatase [candidate division KSB1 bacterium]|nr:arylsulfatase [candidate division KSB1 bacterium]RQW00406.1 MAG: arylsulfatase [candidate division KSB1 bacterium]
MHTTSRRRFLKTIGAAAFSSCTACLCTRKRTRPNIVLIMADDIGYSDIGCYGAEIRTPHLDRLAQNGIRFRQFYNMAKCNPTRSSLLTGLYKGDDRAISFVSLLNDAGYITLQSGKEHFDEWVPECCRTENTFSKSLSFWATTEYFVPPGGKFQRPFKLNGKTLGTNDIVARARQKPFYKTDMFTDNALDWLDEAQKADRPFFLYLPYHSAHYPLQARPEDIEKYRGAYCKGWDMIRRERFERMKKLGILPPETRLSPPEDNINKFRGHPDGFETERAKFPLYRPWASLSEKEKDDYDLEMAVFAAMIDRMDQNIGRIVSYLQTNHLLDHTLVLFMTDNGSCPYDSNVNFTTPPGPPESYRCLRPAWANVGNTPFRYYKQYGHEGGCNTHFIAHWPEVIKPDQITDQVGHVVDLFPTILQAAGIDYPSVYNDHPTLPLHGQSLMPIFQGKQRREPEFFVSGFTERFRMYRRGEWKIVKVNGEEWELYNMAKDRTELDNQAKDQPARVQQLARAYETFVATLP